MKRPVGIIVLSILFGLIGALMAFFGALVIVGGDSFRDMLLESQPDLQKYDYLFSRGAGIVCVIVGFLAGLSADGMYGCRPYGRYLAIITLLIAIVLSVRYDPDTSSAVLDVLICLIILAYLFTKNVRRYFSNPWK